MAGAGSAILDDEVNAKNGVSTGLRSITEVSWIPEDSEQSPHCRPGFYSLKCLCEKVINLLWLKDSYCEYLLLMAKLGRKVTLYLQQVSSQIEIATLLNQSWVVWAICFLAGELSLSLKWQLSFSIAQIWSRWANVLTHSGW